MHFEEAMKFAIASAEMAWDQRHASDDAHGDYRENVRETLAEQGAGCFEAEAFRFFDARWGVLASRGEAS